MKWKKLDSAAIKERIFGALKYNINFFDQNILGVPASHLDSKVFYQDAPFLKDAPFISTLVHNPNHIGCHTLGSSESFFQGTQAVEKEVIEICAEDILKGGNAEFDGYVASGGTEANLQAIWIYRNYFMQEFAAETREIAILCSKDSHYSMAKAANVLGIKLCSVDVDLENRNILSESLETTVSKAKESGIKCLVIVANMMTTMFGSVDDLEVYTNELEKQNLHYKVHIDGAFGGFFYPFSDEETKLNFANPKVNSITLDAHKMVQAPYGTGIFLIRKGFMPYANTKEAAYVEGEDYTLTGSRSGANAVAIWMILMTYGPYGWKEKILVLLNRTDMLCKHLQAKNIPFYRNPKSNIVTMKAAHIPAERAKTYGLVPDNHHHPEWYKIVVMEHVTMEKIMAFIEVL